MSQIREAQRIRVSFPKGLDGFNKLPQGVRQRRVGTGVPHRHPGQEACRVPARAFAHGEHACMEKKDLNEGGKEDEVREKTTARGGRDETNKKNGGVGKKKQTQGGPRLPRMGPPPPPCAGVASPLHSDQQKTTSRLRSAPAHW
eukprot:TRINITY_DN454_c0_g1_i4.p2 TRINITY_DN454_c0_g1~~TRINITY_DN454_c0_g1_i4.p2  ORF type:complete len:144 (-),score=13.38 TRINITY_DN454_c0_g1_i4:60-491(-)